MKNIRTNYFALVAGSLTFAFGGHLIPSAILISSAFICLSIGEAIEELKKPQQEKSE